MVKNGIIPALAGNTSDGREFILHIGDHPRSRGEYPRPHADESTGQGSSPLSRGIPGPKKPC